MKYEIKPSSRFKKDMKLVKKRGYDPRLIETVIKTLANGRRWTKSTETISSSVIIPAFMNVTLHRTGCSSTRSTMRSSFCFCPEPEHTAISFNDENSSAPQGSSQKALRGAAM